MKRVLGVIAGAALLAGCTQTAKVLDFMTGVPSATATAPDPTKPAPIPVAIIKNKKLGNKPITLFSDGSTTPPIVLPQLQPFVIE
jgi:hypothetical protein